MASQIVYHKRVSVQRELYCFIVVVDTQPVLRCAARRDALRYAVLVRRALRQADLIQGDGVPVARRLAARKIPN